jgi:Fic/DOC family
MPEKLSALSLLPFLSAQARSLSEIEQATQSHAGIRNSRRSLQRQLKRLVELGKVQIKGQGKGTRYVLTSEAPDSTAGATSGVSVNISLMTAEGMAAFYSPALIELSTPSRETYSLLRQSLAQRKPVGYQTALLETYTPNHTFYLSESQRGQLMQMGRATMRGGADAVVPAGTFAKDILDRLLIDLSWSSSRLEGNTYSRLDTQRLIEEGLAAPGKDALQAQMILNHKRAIEYLVHGISQPNGIGEERVGVNRTTVIALHALLSDGLLADPMDSGALRTRIVGIGGSVYLPLAMPQRIEELFGIVIGMASEINDPFEQCFFLLVHLPYLQPFLDVNKRTSRLAANIPLIERNLCPLSFIDVPVQAYTDGLLGVYELQRTDLMVDVFLWAYERSCQQYMAVVQQLVPPDVLRLKYRKELGECIQAIVAKGLSASKASVQACLSERVSAGDRDALAGIVLRELQGLHAGNAIRFGVSAWQFQGWQAKAH